MTPTVKVAKQDEQREQAFAIRRKVFVEEQKVPLSLEMDEWENDSIHFVLYDGDKAVGTGRLRPWEGQSGKVERVAVLQDYRGQGSGRIIMKAIEEYARKLGMIRLVLNAQVQAQKFYESLGFQVEGDIFLDAGIEHIKMTKALS
ncbi:GNAT family N-acetyltransferase [Marinithermofilum abyssi]|uniref:GNAT family N-acetyltransferase n=1 Tax=Marinithermofilum abyssi TaxID=1571185 RepID=UPI001E3FAEEB|nr:GNAT family N-acetyltransferase [Marinithermofilum abyssi]